MPSVINPPRDQEEIAEATLRTPAAGQHGAIANNQPGGMDFRRLHVVAVGAGVANMGIGKRDDLAAVGWIREDLLVTGHRGVEYDFADRLPFGANRGTVENGAVL